VRFIRQLSPPYAPGLSGQPGLHAPRGARITVGLVPTDPAALTASLATALAVTKFMSAGLLPWWTPSNLRRTSSVYRNSCDLRLTGAYPCCGTFAPQLFPAPPGLSTCFAFQASFRLRSLRSATAETTRRYMTCAGRTVLSVILIGRLTPVDAIR
jgi:hypothetical protein